MLSADWHNLIFKNIKATEFVKKTHTHIIAQKTEVENALNI